MKLNFTYVQFNKYFNILIKKYFNKKDYKKDFYIKKMYNIKNGEYYL